jgi:hypothetical protein
MVDSNWRCGVGARDALTLALSPREREGAHEIQANALTIGMNDKTKSCEYGCERGTGGKERGAVRRSEERKSNGVVAGWGKQQGSGCELFVRVGRGWNSRDIEGTFFESGCFPIFNDSGRKSNNPLGVIN